jgi:hypothetical protein
MRSFDPFKSAHSVVVASAVVSTVTLGIECLGYILRGENIKSDNTAVSAGAIGNADGSSDEGIFTSEVLQDDVFAGSNEGNSIRCIRVKLSSLDGTSGGVLEWVLLVVLVNLSERVPFFTNTSATGSSTNDTKLVDCDSMRSRGCSSGEGSLEKDGLSWELSKLDIA